MKLSRIFILFILLLLGRQVYPQKNSFNSELSYGVNAGVTFSKVNFNSYLSVPQEQFRQFSGGVTVRYISENHFGIQAELNISQRGWKEKTDSVYLNKYTRSLTYLELPFLTHIYFSLDKRVRLVFNLGPQISYYLGEKEIEREENDQNRNNSYYDLKVERPLDYGLKATAGLEFRTKLGSIIVDGKYYFGLSDIFNSTRADLFQASHNQVMGVNLTYFFR